MFWRFGSIWSVTTVLTEGSSPALTAFIVYVRVSPGRARDRLTVLIGVHTTHPAANKVRMLPHNISRIVTIETHALLLDLFMIPPKRIADAILKA